MKMTKLFFSFLGLIVFTFSAFGQRELPNLTVHTLTGEEINLAEAYGQEDGKITVISFWATWCSPCKKELDAIAELYEEWLEKYDVEVVAISIDTQRSLGKIPGMVATKGWEFTVLHGDAQALQTAFNFSTIPQTYVVDKRGKIVWIHNGYTPGDEYELEEVIEKYNAQ